MHRLFSPFRTQSGVRLGLCSGLAFVLQAVAWVGGVAVAWVGGVALQKFLQHASVEIFGDHFSDTNYVDDIAAIDVDSSSDHLDKYRDRLL